MAWRAERAELETVERAVEKQGQDAAAADAADPLLGVAEGAALDEPAEDDESEDDESEDDEPAEDDESEDFFDDDSVELLDDERALARLSVR